MAADRYAVRMDAPRAHATVDEVHVHVGEDVPAGGAIATVVTEGRHHTIRSGTGGRVEAVVAAGSTVRQGDVVALIVPAATKAWVVEVLAFPGESVRAGDAVLRYRTVEGDENVWCAPHDGLVVSVPEPGATFDPADPRVNVKSVSVAGLGIVGRAPARASTGDDAAALPDSDARSCDTTDVQTVRLADLGEGVREAVVASILVAENTRVEADDDILEVESDKAVVGIPAPCDGIVAKIHVRPGQKVAVGDPLFDIVRGDPPASHENTYDHVRTAQTPGHSASATDTGVENDTAPSPSSPHPVPPGITTPAVPAARRIAREHGIDLATVRGTGPGGAVIVADLAGASASDTVEIAVQRAMSEAMERARAVVRAGVSDTVVLGDRDPRGGWNVALALAVATAAREIPGVVGHYDPARGVVVRPRDRVDIGVAVAVGADLYVPVLRGVCAGDDPQILRARLSELVERARARRLTATDVSPPPHVTVNAFGALGFGIDGSMVVVPPQIAIVGLGRIRRAPIYVGHTLRVARIATLRVEFDHRAVNGAPVARFAMLVAESLARESGSDVAIDGSVVEGGR